jgi:hypothetical protein
MDLQQVAGLWVVTQIIALTFQALLVRSEPLWRKRRIAGGALLAWYMVSFPLVFVSGFSNIVTIVAAGIMLFAMIDAARLWMDRFPEAYVRRAILRDVATLTTVATVVVAAFEAVRHMSWHVSGELMLFMVLTLSCTVGLYMVYRMRWALSHYLPIDIPPVTRHRELPTVTLAIPARNETAALDAALSLAIRSNYPKLEILVLDDCSQDATAQVIRSFAHDGVRFVQGDVPASGWQGKNYACEVLAREASGDVLVFAGVDTHLAPQTITQIVSTLLHTKTDMLSVMPARREFDFWPAALEQLRNFWQIVLPISSRRMPISSPCWAIRADSLRQVGGFASVKNSVFPEVHFARALRAKNAYWFEISSEQLGVTTRKKLSSQLETATRTFYPLLKRRPANVLAISGLLATVLLLPYAVIIWQVVRGELNELIVPAIFAVFVFTVAHVMLLRHTAPRSWMVGLVNFPLLVLLDALLYVWSMLQFEFGEVNWKGRNVCYPLIEAIPMDRFTAAVQQVVSQQKQQVRSRHSR